MTPDEYQKLAMRTNDGQCSKRLFKVMIYETEINPKSNSGLQTIFALTSNGDLINGAMGLCGEAGEVVDLIKKMIFHGHKIEFEEIKKELGDVCWYIAMICDALDFNLEEVMQANIDKLKKRYPNGFSEQDSINRQE